MRLFSPLTPEDKKQTNDAILMGVLPQSFIVQLFVSLTIRLIDWHVIRRDCHTTARRIGIYQIRHTVDKKIAPEDGLI